MQNDKLDLGSTVSNYVNILTNEHRWVCLLNIYYLGKTNQDYIKDRFLVVCSKGRRIFLKFIVSQSVTMIEGFIEILYNVFIWEIFFISSTLLLTCW